MAVSAMAQITGEIVDEDGYAIPNASAIYKGHHVAVVSDINGKFSIERHEGWTLTFSSVGFKTQTVKVTQDTPSYLRIVLKEDSRNLSEVVIKSKRDKYSRKNNPAVELMKRVIAAKERTDLDNHDYYQYNKYQKITFSVNDIKPDDLDKGIFKKQSWLADQIETSTFNNKLILPISVDETVTQHIYRKDPKVEKDIIKGQRSDGINNVLQTGEILNTMLKEIFTDVDIYDDHVRLLQYQFTSPIGETAISFYRFYIEDTVYVDRDLCYHLQFLPNNQQDFGFRGELYVLADSTLHVKRCSLTLPKSSIVNFVDNMKIEQEYKTASTPTVNAIDRLIRDGRKQADNIVLWLDTDIPLGNLRDAIISRIRRADNVQSLTIVRNGKDVTYNREDILKNNWEIKQADFK